MTGRPWDRYLTAQDTAHVAASPLPRVRGVGRRAAVLSVDNYRAVVGDRPEPLLDAIKTWPMSTGLAGWAALDRIAELLRVARQNGVPVLHVTKLDERASGLAGWAVRGGPDADETPADRRYEIVEQAAPLPGELVLHKSAPSAFFGTPLLGHLVAEGIDTLIVCGESVSGCVRATVVDGCSYRFRMVVVEDCVYDRHEASWALNLFDIHRKYGDVVPLATAAEWLRA